MTAPVLMIQGTCSSAGKSVLTAALCRLLARAGWRLAPFKAQNMSNNAAVCPGGAEIGRAQALQAFAAGLAPTADMNPLLLKPEADNQSQLIVEGSPEGRVSARTYYAMRPELWPRITNALDRLRRQYALVVAEGAGSPAELNLRESEMVNMAVARYAGGHVILVGSIELGGIFAQLLGTWWLLPPEEQALVQGFLVNKFRGDPSIFDEGRSAIEARSGRPVLGLVPALDRLALPDEDAASLELSAGGGQQPTTGGAGSLDIAVVRFPRLANFDDFTPLEHEPHVSLRYVAADDTLGQPEAIILPGTKSTAADLHWLYETGLAGRIQTCARAGTPVLGICGGYQMLGDRIDDPECVESDTVSADGLGLLPVISCFSREKQTAPITAQLRQDNALGLPAQGEGLTGYEIHMGRTEGGRPWLQITTRDGQPAREDEGAVDQTGRVAGCYIHGLFHNDAFRRDWLAGLGGRPGGGETNQNAALDRLADTVRDALTDEALNWLLNLPQGEPPTAPNRETSPTPRESAHPQRNAL